jgi:hypothetical protein
VSALNLDPPPTAGGSVLVLYLLRASFGAGCLTDAGPVSLLLLGSSGLGRCRSRCAFCVFCMLLVGKSQQCPQVGLPVGKVTPVTGAGAGAPLRGRSGNWRRSGQ